MSELSIAESIRQDYEEEINKQAKVIQWYEKENRYNQEIIIKDIKEIERLKIIEEKYKDSQLYIKDFKDEIERLNNIIKEVRKYIENNWISKKDADNYRFDDEELDIEISDIAVLYDILNKGE